MVGEAWDERLCTERRASIQNRLNADENRLKQLEKNSAKLTELSVQMGEIIRFQQDQIDKQEHRLHELEQSPLKYTELIRNTAISAGISGIIAYVISMILK